MSDYPAPYTSADAYAEETVREHLTNAQRENASLTERLHNVQAAKDFADRQANELSIKIGNVKGYMADIYSEDGEIDERVKDIARLLDIELTKRISGTALFEISWSAQVPIDFDADDLEISFDVDSASYEADDFDWQEENTEVHAEED